MDLRVNLFALLPNLSRHFELFSSLYLLSRSHLCLAKGGNQQSRFKAAHRVQSLSSTLRVFGMLLAITHRALVH